MTHVFRARYLVLLPLALILVMLVPGVGFAFTTNTVQLDNGTCGRNLQLGSDLTASSSATPTFYLTGDGGASSYQASIDGTSIGTFNGNTSAVVCINDPLHLSDGAHTLTLKELAPNPGNTIAPFAFTVDTTPPATPSAPLLPSYSDTGVVGDNVTSYISDTLIGTSDPNVPIRVYNGPTVVGGALASSSGSWLVRTTTLAPGSYSLTAVAVDEAGNQSAPSAALHLTIDTTAPTVSISSPSPGATVSGTVALAANAADNTAVWKVAFQLDGTTLTTDTTSPYSYSWDSSSVADGSHTLTVIATDTAGNTTSTSETITVQNSGTVTAPSAPTLNTATAANASVSLAWSAPSSNGGSPITGYKVYRGTSSGGETLLTTLGNTTTWTDGSVTDGTTYYYKVSALNSVGEGVASNERSATPSAPATAPSAPTLNSAAASNSSVALAWTAPSNNGGSAITGYRIYRGTSSGGEILLATLGNLTSWTDTTVTNGSIYYYTVSAVNAIGESARSNELSVKVTGRHK
jgi:fibronectin type 3 domain-containing protein